NLGTQNLRKPAMGFGQASEELTYDKMKERVNEELKRSFRPEFLNRIDEVIVFHELTRGEIFSIVDLLIRRVANQLESQDVAIELTEGAKDVLSARGYDPTLGARPLRRAIQRLVEDPISEKILWKEYEAGDTIIVDAADDERGEKEIVFRKAERSPDHPPVELAGATVDGEGEGTPEG
ncbi:MAG TPA: NDP-hexose 4-ketoreductase, partial [Actinomycetota bacterium]|nr:NDP-hexose 4-ketoreductase [Actinomycetota bacterium]